MRTPLYHEHEKLGARIVDFHGWEMPVWYTGIKEEHLAVRNSAGLFDASHMGEIWVSGKESAPFLNRVLTRDIPAMPKNRVLYSFFLNEQGGIIDDLTVYCVEPGESYMLCVNASNTENDLRWITGQNREGALIEDRSSQTALIALQGPDADRILKDYLDFDPDILKNYTFTMLATAQYGDIMISKTGYTGAGGVEIFLPSEKAPGLWSSLVERGARPCGLGARDTLRLEMGYPLHGNDIDETTTPIEAGLSFAVDLNKSGFIGQEALKRQSEQGVSRRLRGLVLKERGVPRQGFECMKNGQKVGTVTSGSVSPVLGTGIALAYLDKSVEEKDEVDIIVRDKHLKSTVVRPPFVKAGGK
ncbi:MAG: glycine cleavage system aminomethyltransferase GcvT [Desulfomonilia bacterium]|jgi:aminomethyltransferase|uniref:aminomethyltransferase n=1 Tax=anaerobic digester metagenome TaxID=1263854 RepID=A0A485M4M6_9ZZZZ|nr:glycine cleavage system aminomethyltransferase GcvT [Pseudomonadota bacterium]HON37809.1 glycine cleavage system aminomethyltransferase GcvT [Deltaproteobacteria bacterium]HRS55700.1 glycine cleavage system aminomethyltransferase GcvT [Desulfomonilia bacterium]HPD20825.1 glycine cleavage system aminomethyltransferase GcvT [Deltaproteobacteria bacterium]HPX18358.1 glycine cleavage system aminomethyltransferase GcvT [Deltaproteobacteria bacterium]